MGCQKNLANRGKMWCVFQKPRRNIQVIAKQVMGSVFSQQFEFNQTLKLQRWGWVWCSFWKPRHKTLVSGGVNHGCKLNFYHVILIGPLENQGFCDVVSRNRVILICLVWDSKVDWFQTVFYRYPFYMLKSNIMHILKSFCFWKLVYTSIINTQLSPD